MRRLVLPSLLLVAALLLSLPSYAKLIPEAKSGFSSVRIATKSGIEVRFGMN